jgi:hypothetical protein
MTPQERQLIDELFDRLARLEPSPRDAEAEAAIAGGLRRAPHAVYALVQTVLVQDQALKRADARIQELEGGEPEPRPAGGFLDSMRDALFGANPSRGSVPNVRPGDGGSRNGPTWNSGQVLGQQGLGQQGPGQAEPRQGGLAGGFGGGGSFLGTAAATAAGVIGGAMLMNGIRGLMGGGHQQSLSDAASSGGGKSPWDSGASSSGDLARDAGLNDMGKGGSRNEERQSFADHASNEHDDGDDDDYDDDDYDSGDFDSGDSDFA